MSGTPWVPDYPDRSGASLPEDAGLNTLLRSLRYIIIFWLALLEILFLSPEELEEMKRALKEESLRQRAEYDTLSRYR
jgi:hypothetical protein